MQLHEQQRQGNRRVKEPQNNPRFQAKIQKFNEHIEKLRKQNETKIDGILSKFYKHDDHINNIVVTTSKSVSQWVKQAA